MKRDKNKTFLLISSVAGILACMFWILRFWYAKEISMSIPMIFNTIQFGCLLAMSKN